MGGGTVEVVSRTIFVEDEIVRPANTTQYTAGDVVADSTDIARMFRFQNCARTPGAGGVIQSAILIDSAAPATKLDSELYLFNTSFALQDDNVAWAPTDTDMEFFVGWISFPLSYFKTAGANGVVQTTDKAMAFVCDAKGVDLYGVLVARNTYTPISAEQLKVRLAILQD